MDNSYITALNSSIISTFTDALKISLRNPPQALFTLKTLYWQKRAQARRLEGEKEGLHAPAIMIVSVTGKCNLNCLGCYSHAQQRHLKEEMSTDLLKSILKQAREFGTSIVLLAGGEPLTRKDLLDVTKDFPDIIFPLFTNGLLIDKRIVERFSKQRNTIPVISIEGDEHDTDGRRGKGVHGKLEHVFKILKKENVSFGVSFTMTSRNFDSIVKEDFIKTIHRNGSRLFFFIDYIPVKEGTEHLVLTKEQSKSVSSIMGSLRKKFAGLFIAFPGDEEALGGCLASRKGLVHISPDGSLEPCPFAPYSDCNLSNMSLKDALGSRLLKEIGDNQAMLQEHKGGCALWENRSFLRSLVSHS